MAHCEQVRNGLHANEVQAPPDSRRHHAAADSKGDAPCVHNVGASDSSSVEDELSSGLCELELCELPHSSFVHDVARTTPAARRRDLVRQVRIDRAKAGAYVEDSTSGQSPSSTRDSSPRSTAVGAGELNGEDVDDGARAQPHPLGRQTVVVGAPLSPLNPQAKSLVLRSREFRSRWNGRRVDPAWLRKEVLRRTADWRSCRLPSLFDLPEPTSPSEADPEADTPFIPLVVLPGLESRPEDGGSLGGSRALTMRNVSVHDARERDCSIPSNYASALSDSASAPLSTALTSSDFASFPPDPGPAFSGPASTPPNSAAGSCASPTPRSTARTRTPASSSTHRIESGTRAHRCPCYPLIDNLVPLVPPPGLGNNSSNSVSDTGWWPTAYDYSGPLVGATPSGSKSRLVLATNGATDRATPSAYGSGAGYWNPAALPAGEASTNPVLVYTGTALVNDTSSVVPPPYDPTYDTSNAVCQTVRVVYLDYGSG